MLLCVCVLSCGMLSHLKSIHFKKCWAYCSLSIAILAYTFYFCPSSGDFVLFVSVEDSVGRSVALSSVESVGCNLNENEIVLIWLRVSARPVCLFEKPFFSALMISELVLKGGDEPRKKMYLVLLANKSCNKIWRPGNE